MTFGFFSLAAREIVQRISKGEWTASEVLEAFISRAALAQELTNCLTEGALTPPPPVFRAAAQLPSPPAQLCHPCPPDDPAPDAVSVPLAF